MIQGKFCDFRLWFAGGFMDYVLPIVIVEASDGRKDKRNLTKIAGIAEKNNSFVKAGME